MLQVELLGNYFYNRQRTANCSVHVPSLNDFCGMRYNGDRDGKEDVGGERDGDGEGDGDGDGKGEIEITICRGLSHPTGWAALPSENMSQHFFQGWRNPLRI